MLSDKLSSPPTLLRSPLHGGVKSRAGTPCSVATDKRLQCSEQLRSTPVDRKRQRSSSGTASRQRKHEFIHPLWKEVFWRVNNAVKIIRRQGVSVCVLAGVSLCVAFTDTAALCACLLAPTLRQKKNSEISLARPTFESHFSEPAPASTTSHSVPEQEPSRKNLWCVVIGAILFCAFSSQEQSESCLSMQPTSAKKKAVDIAKKKRPNTIRTMCFEKASRTVHQRRVRVLSKRGVQRSAVVKPW